MNCQVSLRSLVFFIRFPSPAIFHPLEPISSFLFDQFFSFLSQIFHFDLKPFFLRVDILSLGRGLVHLLFPRLLH